MVFRITPHRQFELGRLRSQEQFSKSARMQTDIATGVRIHRPSDDPYGQRTILQETTIKSRLATQLKVVDESRRALNTAHQQLLDAQSLLVKAKSLSLQARQTIEENEQSVIADQLDSILTQLEAIANSQFEGKYLFGGTNVNVKPYPGDLQTGTSYQGSQTAGLVSLAGQTDLKIYWSGQEVFQPPSSGKILVLGTTGAAAGTGTSSGSAPTTLTVRHTQTLYAAGSGAQPGATSINGDTIIGQAGTHQLTLRDTMGDGSAGTISLNGGPEISWTSADADLKVTGPSGEVVYVNLSNVTAGFDGTVDLIGEGNISIDGGVSETPINFSSHQTLTNNALGVVQHFDTTGITSVGTDHVEFTLNGDIFQTLRALMDDLRNGRNLSPSELSDAIGRRIDDLERGQTHLLNVIGYQSTTLEKLDQLQVRFEDLQLSAEALISDTSGTDYSTAIVQLQEQQNLLQFTLTTLVQLSNISLINFLQ